MNMIFKPSPNYTIGRKSYKPVAIVIHIMEGTLTGTDSWFANPQSKVSAHYGVGKNGEIHRYVEEKNTAWHSGRISSPSCKFLIKSPNGLFVNPNYYTVGIEHEGNEHSEWPDVMYQSSGKLIGEIAKRWNIPLDRLHVVGHNEIYSHKTCPGFKVDLTKLIAIALGDSSPTVDLNIIKKIFIPGIAITKTRLNIRVRPNRTAPPAATKGANVQLGYEGYSDEGENISGNSTWYFTNEGTWFWSGGIR